MTRPEDALKEAMRLYDLLALGPLAAAAKYGPDFEPPTDAEYLEMRQMIKAAIPVAELEGQAVELLREYALADSKGADTLGTGIKSVALLARLEALK